MNIIGTRLRVVLTYIRHLHYITPPKLPENAFTEDSTLPRLLTAIYRQSDVCSQVAYEDLQQFGSQYNKLNELATSCEMNPPKLQRLDGWGGRVDKVVTCDAWKHLHNIASSEGLVAIGHNHCMELREVWQSAKLILFGAVSAMVSCPLAMTDGATTTLIRLLNQHKDCIPGDCSICSEDWKRTVSTTISNLTSTNPQNFWTSGQWMTERGGGSDVTQATETVAVREEGSVIRLYGNKFYTSAIDCNVSLALARYNDNLSLFLVHLPQEYDGTVQVEKLKDKLGTRQLPTAELTLNGLPGLLLAEKGIASIIPVLQVTRLYNAFIATSYLRHITILAHSYAKTRSAFGHTLDKLPLHRASLAKLETFSRALVLQSVDLALILNAKAETVSLSRNVGRVLSAVVKVHTAHVTVTTMRDGLDSFGGAGYMEDTGLPGLFRDACVLPVWEGTADVLSSETMRALGRGSTQADVLRYIRDLAQGGCLLGGHHQHEGLQPCKELEGPVEELDLYLSQLELAMEDCKYTGRSVTLGLGAAHAAAALISFARYTRDSSDMAASRLWCRTGLVPISNIDCKDIDSVLP